MSSRGVQVGDDVLWVDEFHYGPGRGDSSAGARVGGPGRGDAPAAAPAPGPGRDDPSGGVTDPEQARTGTDVAAARTGTDVAAALVRLAADPGHEGLNVALLDRLRRDGFERVPGREVSAAQVVGHGVARCLDGVFVWRAEGLRGVVTYVVAPEPSVRDLLAADLELTRAVVRAACPQPEDSLGELEAGLREAITRLGVVAAGADRYRRPARARDRRVVLQVGPDPGGAVDLAGRRGQRGDRASHDAHQALSRELAELARKVGTASVRPAGRPVVGAREAG